MALPIAAPTTIPFLTAVDPELAVKGSIDPLGFTPLWSRYGREVVGNLTTVASNTRGFTTLILGFHFARRLVEEQGLPEERFSDLFMVFEQLANYSRFAWAEETGDPLGILGIRRVRTRMRDGNGQVIIGPARDTQIMSNQRAYGLWGLYRVSAQDSGLIHSKALSLSAEADAHIRRDVLPRLEQLGPRDISRSILSLMKGARTNRFSTERGHAELAKALAACHGPELTAAERRFYQAHLVEGGPSSPDGRQGRFWQLIRDHNEATGGWTETFGMDEIIALVTEARRRDDEILTDLLDRIRRFETVAAPAARLFGYLQNVDGRTLPDVVDEVRSVWPAGLRHLDPDGLSPHLDHVRALHGDDGVTRFLDLATALREADYGRAIACVLEQNRDVAARRGSGAWIVLEDDGRLRVRHRQEPGPLPEADELETLWVHSYFLGALKRVGAQVHGYASAPPEDEI